MKKIKTDVEIILNTICPYCNQAVVVNLDTLSKYDIKEMKVEIHPIESIVRGVYKRFTTGEGIISDTPIKCKNCFKIFNISEICY
jgi:hypothetical protein